MRRGGLPALREGFSPRTAIGRGGCVHHVPGQLGIDEVITPEWVASLGEFLETHRLELALRKLQGTADRLETTMAGDR